MSPTPTRTEGANPQRETIETDVERILRALEDDECRAILEATSEQARTTSELCTQCDLSTSSAYRKVDMLTEAGLLEESIRLHPSKSHTSEYRLAVEELEITLGNSVECSITAREPSQPLMSAD